MLGYCSECQKYFMDETDYKTVYKVGRPEVTLLLDLTDSSYMVTSGEVFDLEKKHLLSLEKEIKNEEKAIRDRPDYISQYATVSGYDDGNLAYSKAISRKKYEPRLEVLSEYKGRPYQYRVDITADGKTEVYYIGSTDIVLNKQKHVISANSKLGRELVHYKTVKVKKDNLEYSIKLSRQFDINNAILFGYTNLRTDEDIIFRRGITDPFLVRVLNMRKKQHNLIDIFVTIQENQNSIVDARFEKNLIVQGCAGSGKTMVLLHRLSSLKYNTPGFDFNKDALILTPNDHFTLHIKGLAESLQIGSVRRASVEQYYKSVLEEYSTDFKANGAFSSEMSVKQIFVDYIYSDDFRASFEKHYLRIISSRNEYISTLSAIIERMGETPRSVDVSNDGRVIPQLTTILDGLVSKIDTSERKVSSAASTLKETRERKERLSAEIIHKTESAAKVLREAAPRAKTKALAALLETQRAIGEKKNELSLLCTERERLEKDIGSPGEEESPLLTEYSSKNSAWIDSGINDKLQLLSLVKAEISNSRKKQERLASVLSTSYEEVISSQTTDDPDISRLLNELSNERHSLAQLQQNKTRIETGWLFGRSRRLAENSRQIEEAEKAIEKHKAGIQEVLNDRQRELLSVTESLERLHSEMLSMSSEIKRAVDQKKLDSLSTLKRRITRLTNTIEIEVSRLNECLDVVNQLNDEMNDSEIVAWLNQICAFAPAVNDEIRLYDRFLKEAAQVEAAYAGMDEKIATAQQEYESAVSERYPEEVQIAVQNLKVGLSRYSTLGTYQMIFDAAVQQFKEENSIKAIPGKNHRYDLYAQLIFAVIFFGKKPKQIKFICVDEGQDLAENEYRLISELNDNNAVFNIFGDTNQLIKPNRGISDWAELKKMFHADQYILNENYRNTNQITRFCNDSFGMSMLQTGVDGAKVREINKKELERELSEYHIATERVAVLLPRSVQKRKYFDDTLARRGSQSILGDVIAEGKIAVMYVDEVKGIEFDKVYVVSNKMGRNERYIAFTRALSELVVVVDESVPAYDDNSFSSDLTQLVKEKQAPSPVPDLSKLRFGSTFSPPLPDLERLGLPKGLPKPAVAAKTEPVAVDPPYDLEKFVYYTFSHCRTYILEQAAFKGFSSQTGIRFDPGDAIILYPTALGGSEEVFPFEFSETKRNETLRTIEIGVKSFLKARPIDFGKIEFLSGARERLLRLSDELLEDAEVANVHFKQELEQINAFWKNELAQKDRELAAILAQLQRQKEYSSRLEGEKSQLREEFSEARDRLQSEIAAHKETIEFLRRRYDQPKDYNGIVDWVEKHFSGRVFLHPKAVSRMLTKSNQCADVMLVCDALDYLATDYWEQRYEQLPKEVALTRCAEKYGRPFDVTPVGQVTIDFTPGEYKIKYFKNAQGKEASSDLNYHLRVGNDSENLLRIYFLHDDDKKLIVIGSLPDHLRTVLFQ